MPTGLDHRITKVLWLLGLLLSIASLTIGVMNAMLSSVDFQWPMAKMFWSGVDPYAHSHGPYRPEIIMAQKADYGHLLYWLLWPYVMLPWPAAKAAWAATNLMLLAIAFVLMARAISDAPARRMFWIAALLLCIGFAARNVIANGQQTFIVLTSLVLLFTYRHRPLVVGIALALTITKFSFGLQIAAMLVVLGWIGGLVTAAVLTIVAIVLFGWWTETTGLELLLGPLSVARGGSIVGFADLMALGHRLGSNDPFANHPLLIAILLVNALFYAAALWVVTRAGRTDGKVVALLLAGTVYLSLGTVFHAKYDYAMVVFCLFAVIHSGALRRAQEVVLLVFTFGVYWMLPRHEDVYNSPSWGLAAVGVMILCNIGLAFWCLRLAVRLPPVERLPSRWAGHVNAAPG